MTWQQIARRDAIKVGKAIGGMTIGHQAMHDFETGHIEAGIGIAAVHLGLDLVGTVIGSSTISDFSSGNWKGGLTSLGITLGMDAVMVVVGSLTGGAGDVAVKAGEEAAAREGGEAVGVTSLDHPMYRGSERDSMERRSMIPWDEEERPPARPPSRPPKKVTFNEEVDKRHLYQVEGNDGITQERDLLIKSRLKTSDEPMDPEYEYYRNMDNTATYKRRLDEPSQQYVVHNVKLGIDETPRFQEPSPTFTNARSRSGLARFRIKAKSRDMFEPLFEGVSMNDWSDPAWMVSS